MVPSRRRYCSSASRASARSRACTTSMPRVSSAWAQSAGLSPSSKPMACTSSRVGPVGQAPDTGPGQGPVAHGAGLGAGGQLEVPRGAQVEGAQALLGQHDGHGFGVGHGAGLGDDPVHPRGHQADSWTGRTPRPRTAPPCRAPRCAGPAPPPGAGARSAIAVGSLGVAGSTPRSSPGSARVTGANGMAGPLCPISRPPSSAPAGARASPPAG